MPFKAILERVTINRLPGSGPLANSDDHLGNLRTSRIPRHTIPAHLFVSSDPP